MDKKFENLTLHLNCIGSKPTEAEIKIQKALRKAQYTDMMQGIEQSNKKAKQELGITSHLYEEMAYLNQLVLLGISESQAIELHDKYECSYEKLALIVSRGYTTYNEIVDVLSKNTFDIFEQLVYSNITHNFSTLEIPRYKISGGTIKGNLRKPEFDLKIVRI